MLHHGQYDDAAARKKNKEILKTVREKGAAVWLPEEVKERLDKLRMSTVAKLHIRSLAAAIIVTFLDEYEQKVREL